MMFVLTILFQVNWPWWPALVTSVETLIMIGVAAGGVVGIVGLLKRLYTLIWKKAASDALQQGLAVVVTGLMALLTAVVNGQIVPDTFSNIPMAIQLIVTILLTAKMSDGFYKFQKRAGWFSK